MRAADIGGIYDELLFGPAPEGRPYAVCNMVSTIDGKILSGNRDEPVHDLGSRNDHAIMQRIEIQCDAVIVGANSLRASPGWNFFAPLRVTVTKSGNLDLDQPFFKSGKALIVTPKSSSKSMAAANPPGIQWIQVGESEVDLQELLRVLRTEHAVERLMILGGSELNAQFLKLDLVDELFLTLAPKVKLGRDVPTYADGEPLKREELLGFSLSELHRVGDEVFLRYSRKRI